MSGPLRRATIQDLDSIMGLELASFGSDAWTRDTMQRELLGADTVYLVVPSEGAQGVDGYAGVSIAPAARQADIQTIAVTPAARRRGMGRTLLLSLIEHARLAGANEVFLEVRADNPHARALYDSVGFVTLSVRRGYYQPDGVDAVVMRLTLPLPAPPVSNGRSS